ncbi:MAG: hypothetical protein ACOCXQ_04050 [Patescibacteria group bacterium]
MSEQDTANTLPDGLEKLQRLRSIQRYEEQLPKTDEAAQDPQLESALRALANVGAFLTKHSLASPPSSEQTLLDRLTQEAEDLKTQIEEQMNQEEVTQLTQESKARLWTYMRRRRALEVQIETLKDTYNGLITQAMHSPRGHSIIHIETANQLDMTIRSLETELQHSELPYADPESFLTHNLLQLRKMSADLHDPTGIVETPEIGKIIRETKKHLKSKGYVALFGETGTGKTEVAKRIAKEMYAEFHPETQYGAREELLVYLGINPEQTKQMNQVQLAELCHKKYNQKVQQERITHANDGNTGPTNQEIEKNNRYIDRLFYQPDSASSPLRMTIKQRAGSEGQQTMAQRLLTELEVNLKPKPDGGNKDQILHFVIVQYRIKNNLSSLTNLSEDQQADIRFIRQTLGFSPEETPGTLEDHITILQQERTRKLQSEEPFYLIPGNKHTSKEDLLSYLGVTPESTQPEDTPRLVEEAINSFKARCTIEGKEPTDSELNDIREVVMGKAKQITLQTKIVMAEVEKALDEGKIVIIDEVNFIKPGVIATLFDKMNQMKKKDGAGIIFTGNVTQAHGRYLDREQLDPALLNRLGEARVSYETPGMDNITSNVPVILPKRDLTKTSPVNDNREVVVPPKQDLFQIGLAHLIDQKGNLYGPSDAINQTWKISQVFKILQDNYAGRPIDNIHNYLGGAAFQLKNVHASMRNFGEILRTWRAEGYNKPLDYYIYQNLIKPAISLDPKEAAYIQQIAYLHGFFSDKEGSPWKDVFGTDSTTNKLSLKKQIDQDAMHIQDRTQLRLFSTQEVCEAFSGIEMPKDINKVGEEQILNDADRAEILAEIEPETEKLRQQLKDLEGAIELYCRDAAVVFASQTVT